jgi:hypothetical protein
MPVWHQLLADISCIVEPRAMCFADWTLYPSCPNKMPCSKPCVRPGSTGALHKHSSGYNYHMFTVMLFRGEATLRPLVTLIGMHHTE